MNLKTSVMDAIHTHLRDVFGERFQRDVELSRYTSARIGGPAEMFVTVTTTQELVHAAELAYNLGLPYFLLGGGSNILVADGGVPGLVIFNRARDIRFRHTGASVICTVESGVNLSSLTRQCIAKGLGGLEWAVNVPGTVGGAVVGNAGAHGGSMADSVRTVTVWKPGVGIRTYEAAQLEYGYRDSVLKREQGTDRPRRVVLSAELELTPETATVLQARADGFVAQRKQTQPTGASCGSMFKNPEHFYAGYLIEAAGLKGYRHGNAVISEKHANFFINDGGATAEEVRALIAEAWNSVREQFNVEMELEVELIGRWDFE